MTSSLAWPVAVVVIVFLLRRQLVQLLQRIAEVTLPGGYKVVFHEALEEGRAAIEQIGEIGHKPKELARHRARDHAYLEYRTSITEGVDIVSQMLAAYAEVEDNLTELAAAHSLTGSYWAIWRALESKGVISSSAADAIENLRKARNALVHIPQRQLMPPEAIEFIAQAELLSDYLKRLIEKAPGKRN
jgi:uncharacterized protein YutE (UPF0331/DUF86 family)